MKRLHAYAYVEKRTSPPVTEAKDASIVLVNLPLPMQDKTATKPRNVPRMTLQRRLAAEALGTAFLLAIVIGTGIMSERLANGNAGLALLINTVAIGTGLVALILTFSPISGAHFNPIVTLSAAWQGNTCWHDVLPYILVQIAGAFAGVAAAHLMFGEPLFSVSQHVRTGPAQWWSEFVATFGLIAVIIGSSRSRPAITPFAIAAYIMAACWFTSSSPFANPALTLARAASGTLAGIRPVDSIGFIAAQLISSMGATLLMGWIFKEPLK